MANGETGETIGGKWERWKRKRRNEWRSSRGRGMEGRSAERAQLCIYLNGFSGIRRFKRIKLDCV